MTKETLNGITQYWREVLLGLTISALMALAGYSLQLYRDYAVFQDRTTKDFMEVWKTVDKHTEIITADHEVLISLKDNNKKLDAVVDALNDIKIQLAVLKNTIEQSEKVKK